MFLVFKPNGRALRLGKRYGSTGWFLYGDAEEIYNDIKQFYEDCMNDSTYSNQDDFCIVMEEYDGKENINTNWQYDTESNKLKINFK